MHTQSDHQRIAAARLAFRSHPLERRHGVLCGAVVEALGGEARAEVPERAPFPDHGDVSPREGALRNVLSVACLSETVAVSLTDPGTPLRGTVTLAAGAASDRGIASVRFQTAPAGTGTWADACAATSAPKSARRCARCSPARWPGSRSRPKPRSPLRRSPRSASPARPRTAPGPPSPPPSAGSARGRRTPSAGSSGPGRRRSSCRGT